MNMTVSACVRGPTKGQVAPNYSVHLSDPYFLE